MIEDENKFLEFKMAHLDNYAIIDGPCTAIVKNNSSLNYYKTYDLDNNPRWVLNIKAITRDNFNLIKSLVDNKVKLTYNDIGHLLMKGAIWANQIIREEDLPVKGEDIICVFGYVKDILRCTSITVIPKVVPEIYNHNDAVYDEIKELEKLINLKQDE